MSDSGKLTRRAAIGLVVGGGVLAAHQTFGLSRISADRFTQVDLAGDEDALLSIVGQTAAATPTFTNRADSTMDVTLTSAEESAEFDVGGDGNYEKEAEFELMAGEEQKVEMQADVEEIVVDVSAAFGGGTITLDRVFHLSETQAGQIDISATVEATGGSGKFSFGMWNQGDIDAEMVSLRVDETTTDAVEVDGDRIFSLDSSESDEDPRQLISSPLQIGEDEPLTPFDDGDSVILNQEGDELVFEFDRFQNPPGPGRPHADMQGETVWITVEFSDGSQGSFELSE